MNSGPLKGEALVSYHSHVKFKSVEHKVGIFFIKGGEINISYKSAYGISLTAYGYFVSHFKVYIVGVHTVKGDFFS